MATCTQSLQDLAKEVTDSAKIVQDFLVSKDIQPSFDSDAPKRFPTDTPDEIWAARSKLLGATRALHTLSLGPAEYLKWFSNAVHDTFLLHWIVHFRIAEIVPTTGKISYGELAKIVNVEVSVVRRIVRQVMLLYIFCEPEPDFVAHSATSLLICTDPTMRAYVYGMINIMLPMEEKLVESHQYHGHSRETSHCPWNLANNVKDVPVYEWWDSHEPAKAAEFGKAMEEFKETEGWGLHHLDSSFGWSSLPPGSKVVDIGGSFGTASIYLAERFPHLKFVVQDLPNVASEGSEKLPEQLKERVEFMGHDFFEPQPIKDAQVYYIQDVLIDHPDDIAIKILSQLASAMKNRPDTRLVIRDGILPAQPGSLPVTDELHLRRLDYMSLLLANGGHRDLAQWKAVLAQVKPQLQLLEINRPPGSLYSAIVLRLGT